MCEKFSGAGPMSRLADKGTGEMLKYDDLTGESGEKIAVVGLGYVGLPLVVSLARDFNVIGFDVSEKRIRELSQGQDRTREVDEDDLKATSAVFSSDPAVIKDCPLVLVAVPTPIDAFRTPDLTPVKSASRTVGQNLAQGAVVVYESTVYPGLTEDVCGPILEKESGKVRGRDFWLGYSPERVNPGDKKRTLNTITKVVSGENPEVAELLAQVYSRVVDSPLGPGGERAKNIHKASSIKVAEAAKVIENTQRDLNIALMNELAVIFDKLGIDTLEVIEAAATKWNFLPFKPGLVGGHCIGVDPYYLTFKAESLGFHPETILAGRRINDSMGKFIAETTIKKLIKYGHTVKGAKIGVLGLTFKENVPDLRNTRVVDVVAELEEYGVEVLVHDAFADPEEAMEEYSIPLVPLEKFKDLEAVVLAVPHEQYKKLGFGEIKSWYRNTECPVLIDVKGALDKDEAGAHGFEFWRL